MTKLTTTSNEKPPSEPVVDEKRVDVDDEEDDEDVKKNIYNEIPEYDDLDDVKIDADEMTKSKEAGVVLQQLQQLNHLQQLQQQNAVNENLYSEIHLNEERFENAVYMQNQQQNPQKVVDGDILPSKSSKTRSFFPVGVPLPGIPQQGEHRPKMIIPEEAEPSWCCGTRRRRRRSLILGLFLTSFFLLFLCIALMVRMYVPNSVVDYDEGESKASAVKAAGETSRWPDSYSPMRPDTDGDVVFYDNDDDASNLWNVVASDVDVAVFALETAPTSASNELPARNPPPATTTPTRTASSTFSPSTSTSSSSSSSSTSGFDVGISSAEFLQGGGTSDWAADNQMGADAEFTPTEKTIKRTSHTKSMCTSWQGRRHLTLSCDDPDARIRVQRSFYGWSHSETVCHLVSGDTTCRVGESDVAPRCNGYNSCRFSADPSGWVVGCHGFHDFLQVDFFCVS